jgi:hypothetical protein
VTNDVELGDECSVLLYSGAEWRRFVASDWDMLDARWSEYIAGGKMIDRIITTEYSAGGTFMFLLSEVRAMDRCSREERRRGRDYYLAMDAEKKADGMLE